MLSASADQATVEILGAIGGILAGVAAILGAVAVILWGPSLFKELGANFARQRAMAAEQEKMARIDRHRILHGWKHRGLNVYRVELVTEPDEMQRAVTELAAGEPSTYVMLRLAEPGTNYNRAASLRDLIEVEGYVTRPPTDGEREAIDLAAQQLIAADEAEYGQEPSGANEAWWRRPRRPRQPSASG